MYERDIEARSYISTFRHNGERYEHNIFCADDDRVECIDMKGNVILTFTSNCYVFTGSKNDPDRQQLGTLHMWHNDQWHFQPEGEDRKVELCERDILKGELTVSKMYLNGEFKIKPKAKEGA